VCHRDVPVFAGLDHLLRHGCTGFGGVEGLEVRGMGVDEGVVVDLRVDGGGTQVSHVPDDGWGGVWELVGRSHGLEWSGWWWWVVGDGGVKGDHEEGWRGPACGGVIGWGVGKGREGWESECLRCLFDSLNAKDITW